MSPARQPTAKENARHPDGYRAFALRGERSDAVAPCARGQARGERCLPTRCERMIRGHAAAAHRNHEILSPAIHGSSALVVTMNWQLQGQPRADGAAHPGFGRSITGKCMYGQHLAALPGRPPNRRTAPSPCEDNTSVCHQEREDSQLADFWLRTDDQGSPYVGPPSAATGCRRWPAPATGSGR